MTSVTIPKLVTSIADRAFCGCSGLTSVTIPESVTSIGNYAFEGCSSLPSVTIPRFITKIGYYAFNNCASLTTLYYNVINATNLTFETNSFPSTIKTLIIGEYGGSIPRVIFDSFSNLETITVQDGNLSYDSRDNCNAIIDKSSNKLMLGCKNTVIPNSVTSIDDYAFYFCSGLTSLSCLATTPPTCSSNSFSSTVLTNAKLFVPSSALSAYKKANIWEGFSQISAIRETIASGTTGECSWTLYDDSTLTISGNGSMAYYSNESSVPWYSYRKEIKNVKISDGVTGIANYAFYGCTGLPSITIPNSVTSIGNQSFYGCSGLTSVCIPNSVTSIGGKAFYYCSGLTSVTISNSLTSLGSKTFYGCSGLTSVVIPNSLTTTGDYTFYDCKGLISVTIPNSVTIIGDHSFYGCKGLSSVTIPNSVTSIAKDAFSYCTGLTSITIPDSVKSIGNFAFEGCSNLQSIYSESVTPPTVGGTETFTGIDKSIPVYVPKTSVDAYKTARYWSDFTNISALYVKATSISLNSDSVSLNAGETTQFTVTVLPDDANSDALTWSSSDETVATVSNEGIVTAVGGGTATITVATTDGSELTDSCKITVIEQCATPTISIVDGKLQFRCETAGAGFHYTVKKAGVDMDSYSEDGLVDINTENTYTVTCYATADGYVQSPTVTETITINSADVNGDGKVDVNDVNAVISRICGN